MLLGAGTLRFKPALNLCVITFFFFFFYKTCFICKMFILTTVPEIIMFPHGQTEA